MKIATRPTQTRFPHIDLHAAPMAPMIDDDDSDDEIPLAARVGVKKESGTPKGTTRSLVRTLLGSGPRVVFKLPSAQCPIVAYPIHSPSLTFPRHPTPPPPAPARKPSAKKKKKKKPAGASKKADTKPKTERKVYDLAGQKRDSPDATDSLRKFYLSLRSQKPESDMAEVWLMEHGLLPEEEQKKAYKIMMSRKQSGKSVSAAKRPASAKPRATPPAKKSKSKSEEKAPPAKKGKAALVDDDSDDDAPLASLKRAAEGGGFQIPKTEAAK